MADDGTVEVKVLVTMNVNREAYLKEFNDVGYREGLVSIEDDLTALVKLVMEQQAAEYSGRLFTVTNAERAYPMPWGERGES